MQEIRGNPKSFVQSTAQVAVIKPELACISVLTATAGGSALVGSVAGSIDPDYSLPCALATCVMGAGLRAYTVYSHLKLDDATGRASDANRVTEPAPRFKRVEFDHSNDFLNPVVAGYAAIAGSTGWAVALATGTLSSFGPVLTCAGILGGALWGMYKSRRET